MKFTILGIPKPQQSFKFTKTGIRYQPKETKQNTGNIRSQIIAQLPDDWQPLANPIWIKRAWFVFPPLKNFSKEKMRLVESEQLIKPTSPDLHDNLFKATMDAMQGIVFNNDSQVCALDNVKRLYGLRPRIEIELEEI